MHRHSTNAVIQFIQMENNYVLKLLLSGQSVGDTYLCVPQPKCWGDVSPRPPIIAAPDLRVQSLHRVTPVIFAKKTAKEQRENIRHKNAVRQTLTSWWRRLRKVNQRPPSSRWYSSLYCSTYSWPWNTEPSQYVSKWVWVAQMAIA